MTTSPRRTRRSLVAPAEETVPSDTEAATDEDLEMLMQTRARLSHDEFELLYGASELGREILAREAELKPTAPLPLAGTTALGQASGSSSHSTDGAMSSDELTAAPGSSQARDGVRVATGEEDTATSPELSWASPTSRIDKLPLSRSTGGAGVKVEPATRRRVPVLISSLSFGDPGVGSGPPRLHLPQYPPPPPPSSLLASSSFASASTSPIKKKRNSASTTKRTLQSAKASASPTEDDDASDEYVAKPKPRKRQVGGAAAGSAAAATGSQASTSAPARTTSAEWTVFCHFTDPDTEVECGAGFVRTYDLKRHEDTVHLGAPSGAALGGAMHACPECDRTFSRKDAMLRHRKTIDHSIPVEERRGKQGGGGSLKRKTTSA